MIKNREIDNRVGVCLVTESFYPLYAGPAIRFQRYAPGLKRRGVQMRVFTEAINDGTILKRGSLENGNGNRLAPLHGTSKNSPLFEVIDGLSVQRVDLPNGLRRKPAFLSSLVKYCENHRSEIDVIQFLNLENWWAPWVNRLRRLGINTVFTHTMQGEFSPNPLRRAWQRFNRRLLFNSVDRIVVSTKIMSQQLKYLDVSPMVDIIPNGVDLQRFRPPENESVKLSLRRKLDLGPNWDIIIAVGPINPRKGVDVLIDAFIRLAPEYPNSHLVFVGPRHDQSIEKLQTFHQRLQDTIRTAKAQDRVHFIGAINNVDEYLRTSDILAFPSRQEGMPNVVPEAMACGLPVILMPFTGLSEEFGSPGLHYVLSDWNVKVLASDIRRLLVNRPHREMLGREARRWVEQNLDVNHSMNKYAAMYHEVTERSKMKHIRAS